MYCATCPVRQVAYASNHVMRNRTTTADTLWRRVSKPQEEGGKYGNDSQMGDGFVHNPEEAYTEEPELRCDQCNILACKVLDPGNGILSSRTLLKTINGTYICSG